MQVITNALILLECGILHKSNDSVKASRIAGVDPVWTDSGVPVLAAADVDNLAQCPG